MLAGSRGRSANHARPRTDNHARAFALYAVDPGGTSGWARGVFVPQETVVATLKSHNVEAGECRGPTLDQAFQLAASIVEFRARCRASGIRDFKVLFEGFQLRTQNVDLAPVEVIAGTRVVLSVENIFLTKVNFQTPSQGMTYATNDRLKRWGLYDVGRGSPHKRDALRHLALGVSRKLDGKL